MMFKREFYTKKREFVVAFECDLNFPTSWVKRWKIFSKHFRHADLHVTNKNSFIRLLVNKVACFASAPRRKLWSKYLMLDITRAESAARRSAFNIWIHIKKFLVDRLELLCAREPVFDMWERKKLGFWWAPGDISPKVPSKYRRHNLLLGSEF